MSRCSYSSQFAGTARAQEASIIGQVTDASGAVLPGVTVTATSPALLVQQVTDVTNERGEYRLTPLPIGTYDVDYMLPGFVTVRRQALRLTAGFTAKVDVSLAIGGVAETLTVSGAAPIVDVKATAARAVDQGNARSAADESQRPHRRDGAGTRCRFQPRHRREHDGHQSSFRAFGQSGESWTTIEGIATTSVRSALDGSGNQFDYASFEETTVQTVGHSARGAEPRHSVGRHRQVRRQRFPRQRLLVADEQSPPEQQPRRGAAGPRGEQREPGRSALGPERGAGWTRDPQQAVVLHVGPRPP